MWRPLQRDEETYHIAFHDKVETTTYSPSHLVGMPKGVKGDDKKIAHLQVFGMGLRTSKITSESTHEKS